LFYILLEQRIIGAEDEKKELVKKNGLIDGSNFDYQISDPTPAAVPHRPEFIEMKN